MPFTPQDVANISLPPHSNPGAIHPRTPPREREKFKRFETLTLEQRAVVDNMLMKVSPPKVATMIQQEWKIWTDIAPFTLEQLLRRYKDEVVFVQMAAAYTRLQSKSGPAAQAYRLYNEQVNVLEELAAILDTQKARLIKILQKEEKSEEVVEQIAVELNLLMKIVDKVGYYQLETGIMRRAPKQVKGSVTFDSTTGAMRYKIQETYDPQLAKVLEQARRVIDGSYVESSPESVRTGDDGEGGSDAEPSSGSSGSSPVGDGGDRGS
jgi:hypothetical protein